MISKETIEKALSMRRDYTMTEIAQLLGERQEELFEAIQKRVEGPESLPEPIPAGSGPDHPKRRTKPGKRKKGA